MFKKKPKNPPLKVSLVGMNERALQLFGMFLDGPVRGSCEVVSDHSQDAIIIDMDGVESSRLWLDVRRKFQGPVIALSVTEKHINLNNAFWVSKPVKADAFLEALSKVRAALQNPPKAGGQSIKPASLADAPVPTDKKTAEAPPRLAEAGEPKTATSAAAQRMSNEMDEKSQNCCGNIQDETYTDPRAQAELFFDPATTLLGVYREAMQRTAEGGIAKIEGLGAHPIYVGQGKNFASTPMPEAYLRAICARSISASPVSIALVELEPKDIGISEDPRLRRLDNMLWKISLWTSRGRVPLGTSLTAPVRLRSWPNIPRLMSVPHGMRIAALWVTQPSGLLESAQKLDVPYRFVFAFYCACQSFGLVEFVMTPTQSTEAAPSAQPASKEKRSLFGSLLKKLGFG